MGGLVLPAPPVPMLPVWPAGTVEPGGAVGAAPAAVALSNVTLKQSVLFGVVVAVNVVGNKVVPITVHVTTAPGVVAFGLPSTTVFSSSGLLSTAGQITSIVGTARQFQFGAKITF